MNPCGAESEHHCNTIHLSRYGGVHGTQQHQLSLANPDGQHGMLTLEIGARRIPVRFGSELSVTDSRDRGRVFQARGCARVSGSAIA